MLFATTELHAIVFFQWLEPTSLLEQTHSVAPHIENLKSTPCGQIYFNPRSPASPPCLRPDQGFGCHCYSKGRPDLVITVVSGVALARMLKPEITHSAANRTANRRFNSTIKKSRKQQQSCSGIACRNWQNYNKCGLVCVHVTFFLCVAIKCVYA